MFTRDRLSAYIARVKILGKALRAGRRVPIRNTRARLSCELLETRFAPANLSLSIVQGDGQPATVGKPFTTLLEVSVVDVATHTALGGEHVTFAVLNGTNGAGAMFAGATTVTTADGTMGTTLGLAIAPTLVADDVTGSFSVVAFVSDPTATAQPVIFQLTNKTDPAIVIATAGDGQSTPPTAPFGTALQVQVTDVYGNPVANQMVTFTAPHTNSAASATFADTGTNTTTATTNAQGIATAPVLTANGHAGTLTVTAMDDGAVPATFNLTNAVGPPALLTITKGNEGQSAAVGHTFGTDLVVSLTDAFNNPLPNVTITFTELDGPSTAGATFQDDPGALTRLNPYQVTVDTDASGTASIAGKDILAGDTGGKFSIVASVGSLSATFFLNDTGPTVQATALAVASGNGQVVNIGLTFAALQVQLVDSNGDAAAIANVPVKFSVPTNGATGTFSGLTPSTATILTTSQGVATAPLLTANNKKGDFNVTVTSPGLTATQFQLHTTAVVAAGLVVASGNGQPVPDGGTYQPLKVQLVDANGSPVALANIPITFTAPTTGPTVIFSGRSAGSAQIFTDNQGVATSPLMTADGQGDVTVTATSPSLTEADFLLHNTSSQKSLVVKGASSFNTVVNKPFQDTPDHNVVLQVQVQDAKHNGVPNDPGPVTFSIGSSNKGATAYFVDASGIPFSQITVNTPDATTGIATTTGYTLVANSVSDSYVVTVQDGDLKTTLTLINAPDSQTQRLALIAGSNQSATVNSPFVSLLEVGVTDQFGNPLTGTSVSGEQVQFQVLPASFDKFKPSGKFGTDNTTKATVNPQTGLAVAVALTADQTAGDFTVVATLLDSSGISTGVTTVFALTNTPGPAEHITPVTASTPQSARVGTTFATPLQALVTDASGNPLADVPVTFIAPAGESLGGAPEVLTNGLGIATAPSVTAVTTGATGVPFVVTANVSTTDANGNPVTLNDSHGNPLTASYNLTNIGPTTITVISGDGQATPIGSPFSQLLQAQVLDQNGQPMANVPVTFAVSFVDEPLTDAVWNQAAADATLPVAHATFTTGYGQGLNVGDIVTINHVSSQGPDSFNGTWTVKRVDNGNEFDAVPTDASTVNPGTATGFGDALVPVPAISSATADVAIVAASWQPTSGGLGVATFTTKSNPNIAVGDTVTINNMMPIGYDGTFTVSSVNGNQFTIKSFPNPTSSSAASVATGLGDVQVPVISGSSEIFASSPTVLTNAQGIATAPALTANLVVSPPRTSYYATASVDGATNVTPVFYTLTNTGVPYTVNIASDVPASLMSEANAFHFVLPVVVTDFYGRPIPNATLTFNVVALNTLSAPKNNTPSGSFNGSSSITVRTDQNGEALVTTLARNKILGKFGVDVYAAGDPIPYRFTLTNASVPPKTVAVDPPSSFATVDSTYLQSGNASFQQHFAALVTDASGNPLSGVAVTFSVPNNPQKPGGNFQGAGVVIKNGQSQITEITGANGVATVPTANGLVANGVAGSFAMTVSTTLTGYHPNTISLKNIPGVPDPGHITATVVPVKTMFGTVFNLQVTVADKDGNAIPSVAVGLTMSSVPDGVFFANSLDITSAATTNAKGIATAQIRALNKKVPYTLTVMVQVAVPDGSIVVPITIANVMLR